MVKKLGFILLVLSIAFPAFAHAGDFTATVDRNSVAAGESFTLELALSNANAKGAPDTQALKSSFIIASQGQSSSTTIINGAVTSSTGWELTLIPKTEGKLTIPPLSIETSEGTLSTQPITMDVEKAAAVSSPAEHTPTTITAHASTLNPYKGQPIFYTIKIVARSNVADLSLDDLKVENAIVESQGKPKISDVIENGAPVKVIESRYIITPLSSGKITIPPMLLQGKMQQPGRDPFDAFTQMDSDPFGMLQHMNRMGGLMVLKPFSVASNDVQLDVRPPAAAMDPWLPLTSLKITEDISDTQSAKAGEPITRKITLTANGAVGKELPSLEPQQNHTDFKVYADKPVTENSIKGETIIGTRKESYSLIPLQSGKLTLPEIKVPWWDIRTNRIAYAELPARTLDILPGVVAPNQLSIPTAENQEQHPSVIPSQNQQAIQQTPQKNATVLYAIIGFLSLVLLSVIIWAVRLRGSNPKSGETAESIAMPTQPVITQSKQRYGKSDLMAVSTVKELDNFIRNYASQQWGTRKNASLEEIFSDMAAKHILEKETASLLVKEITAALYAGKEVNFFKLKEQCNVIFSSMEKPKNIPEKPSRKLPELNPS